MAGTIERGAFSLFLANFAFFISSYLVYFGLGRLLDEASFGVYSVVISLISLINIVLMAAVEQTVSKFVSENPSNADSVKKTAFLLHLSFSSLIFIAFVLLVPAMAFLLNDLSLMPLFYLVSPLIFVHPVFRLFTGCLNGLKKFSLQARLLGFYSAAKVLLILGLVFLGFGLVGAVLGFLASSAIAVLVSFFLLGVSFRPASLEPGKIVAFAFPVGLLALISNFIMTVDLFAVKALTNPLSSNVLAGYYTAASTIAKVTPTLVIALSVVLFPLVSGSSFKGDVAKASFYVRSSLRYALLVVAFLSTAFFATAPETVSFVFGQRYIAGAAPLQALAFGFGAFALFSILLTVVSASGRPRQAFALGLSVLVLDILLNLLLVPGQGMMGAAFSTLLSCFLGMLLTASFVGFHFGKLLSFKTLARAVVASAVVLLVSNALTVPVILLPFKYFALLVVYGLALLALRELNRFDLLVFKNVVVK